MGLLDKFKRRSAESPAESKKKPRKKVNVSKRFELMRRGVSGTMSQFFMAKDRDSDKVIGLKVADSEKTAPFEDRFRELKKPPEGRIAVEIEHPNVVTTYEYGTTTDGKSYVVMEYIKGKGLHKLLYDRESILEGRRVKLVRQMAESIRAVHRAGFVHRDICPRNFICAPDCESLKLIDFGLTLPDQEVYHQPGNRTGTPLYMAPEIIRRRHTDHRVDIFAFGVTAYQTCTYELPWPVTDTTGLAALSHDTQKPEDILYYRPRLNKKLAAAIMKCIEANPKDRFRTMDDFLSEIKDCDSDDE